MKCKIKKRKDFKLMFAVNCLLIFAIVFNASPVFSRSLNRSVETQNLILTERFLRTELYFGMNKPDESVVTEEEWNKFLADEVTPKFPKGFTVLQGLGQYQDLSGKIVKENSRVIVLLYSLKERKSGNRKIEQIRSAYKKAFQQESVLRLDFPYSVRVSF